MNKIILAGDLSLACPAFCVMEINLLTQEMRVLHLSHIKTNSKRSTGYRLWQIANHLENEVLGKYHIDEAVVEKGFSRFPTATQQLQRVVGTVFYTLYRKHELDPLELSVSTVKKAVTGSGKADKEEVAKHLYQYIKMDKFATDDESDACAVAVAFAKYKKWV